MFSPSWPQNNSLLAPSHPSESAFGEPGSSRSYVTVFDSGLARHYNRPRCPSVVLGLHTFQREGFQSTEAVVSTTHRESEKLPIPNMAGKAMSVRGPIDPGRLGTSIMHEHIFLDIRKRFQPTYDTPATEFALWDQKVTLANLHLARQRKPIGDNYILTDEQVAIAETSEYRNFGGNTIVELTSKGLRPDPLAMRRVSYATGLNVVMGTGWYTKRFYPDNMDQRTVEDMTEEIIGDITVGVGQTGIRAGIIGEVGVDGNPITPNEIKSIRAAARASRATGAAISFHRGGVGHEKLQVLGILGEEGADLSRTILGHSDEIAGDLPLMKDLLEQGVYIQFDLLGRLDIPLSYRPTSPQSFVYGYALGALVTEGIVNLIKAGYEDRILLSQDVGTKIQLKSYGGAGYSFLLETFLPHLRALGVTEERVNKFMVDNPKRVLTFVAPK